MHIADERLVDLALGEPADAGELDHLAGCEACVQTRSALSETISVTQRSNQVSLLDPPAQIWDAVRAEIGHPTVSRADADGSHAPVTDLHARRVGRSRFPMMGLLAAACVLGILLGVGGATIVNRLGGQPDPGETVASAPLAPLESAQVLGVASLAHRDGGLRLDLPALDLDPGDGFLEVWLINEDLTRMISIGVLPADADGTVLPVPQQLIDQGYVIVDISREPFDDQPAHSGDTLVRGQLSI